VNCPKCGGATIVTRVQYKDDGDQRRRKCIGCGFAFYTVERMEAADTTQAFQASLFQLLTDDARSQARQLCNGKRRG